MAKRLLQRDYLEFVDYLVNNNECEKNERGIPLLNFCEENFYKNKDSIIHEINECLKVCCNPNDRTFYQVFLKDIEDRIKLWREQYNTEFNMDIKYLKVIRLYVGFIDFKTLSRSELLERKEIIKFAINKNFSNEIK